MAMSLEERLRVGAGTTVAWLRDRQNQAAANSRDLEALGRKVVHDAIRSGRTVKARTEAELRELGREASAQIKRAEATVRAAAAPLTQKPSKPQPASRPPPSRRPPGAAPSAPAASDALQQARAAVSGAVDEASFGVADYVSAGLQAFGAGRLSDLPEQFSRELAEERAQDAYDAENYGLARGAGQVVGLAGSLVATGGAGAAAKAAIRTAPRVARAFDKASKAANATKRIVPLTPVGLTTMAGAGGAGAGVVGQGVSDGVAGQLSDPQDYLGAAAGGAIGGLTARIRAPGGGKIAEATNKVLRNPMFAGGVEGAATNGLQSVLGGEEFDFIALARAGRGGAVGARAGEVVGKYGTNRLPRKAKGELGEALSVVKSTASGDPLWGRQVADFDELLPNVKIKKKKRSHVSVPLAPGEATIADHVTPKGVAVEAKFGPRARLSSLQRQARRQFAEERYRIDHWLPSDIGRAGGVAFGAAGAHLGEDDW